MRTIFTVLAATAIMGLAGCQVQQPKQEFGSGSVLDVRPVRSSTPRFAPPSMVATPPEEPAVATASDPSDSAATARSMTRSGRSARSAGRKGAPAADGSQQTGYKVKKGDTLYRIAKTEYGDGKKWTVIASANPGISPQSLKAGQTIVIP